MAFRTINIVGGGIIGLSTGWKLAERGLSVRIFERGRAGHGASHVAAGMLSADAEIGFEEIGLYQVSRESLRRWPEFARTLERAGETSVGYRDRGTLMVADDRDHEEALRRVFEFQCAEGVDVQWLSAEEAQELEPFLAPGLTSAVLAPRDHLVDPRKVIQALTVAFKNAGGELFENCAVSAILPDKRTPRVILDDGTEYDADLVVLSAGAWSGQIEGLENSIRPAVRPVKGQIIELDGESPFDLQYVVRGPAAYLVPHADGRIMLGATSEEMGFDTRVTAGAIYTLLEGARDIVPGISDLPVAKVHAGFRPGSLDNSPIIGPSRAPGVYFATGHFRSGILLSAITAEEIAREISEPYESSWFSDLRPQRFDKQNMH